MIPSATPIIKTISQWHAAREGSGVCARVPKDLLAQHERITQAQRHVVFTETLRRHVTRSANRARDEILVTVTPAA